MVAALLGFFGVLVGSVLTHLFTISNDWRNRRMEAMVASVTASTRVLGTRRCGAAASLAPSGRQHYGAAAAAHGGPATDRAGPDVAGALTLASAARVASSLPSVRPVSDLRR